LNALIAKSLILQEGESKGVIVTQKELDEKVKKLEKTFSRQGQTLDQYLQARKMSRQSFLEEIKIQIVIEKLLGKDIAVSDKEIHDYIEQNKDALPKDVKPEDIKEQVAQELVNQKIQMKIPALLQNLQKKYKVNRFLGGSSTIMPQ